MSSYKQGVISSSTMEAECTAASVVVAQMLGLRDLFLNWSKVQRTYDAMLKVLVGLNDNASEKKNE